MNLRALLAFVSGVVLVPAVVALAVPDHPPPAPAAPQAAPAAPAQPGLKLGAALPSHSFEAGPYRAVVYKSGKVVMAPRLAAHYHPLAKGVKSPPPSVDYYTKARPSLNRMYLNDSLGDCVIAEAAHAVGVYTAADSGVAVQFTDQDVRNYYAAICGHLGNDVGCVVTEVMDYQQRYGLKSSSTGLTYKLDGYAAVDWTNKQQVMAALYLFGSLNVAVALPHSWWTNAHDGAVWDVPVGAGANVVGGHCIAAVGYNQAGVQCATWGVVVTITWNAFLHKGTDAQGNYQFVSELYAPLSPNWYGADNLAPNGVNAVTLKSDLTMLQHGQIPPVPDPPQPPVPPNPNPPVPPNPPTPPPVVTRHRAYSSGPDVWWYDDQGTVHKAQPFGAGWTGEIRLACNGTHLACGAGPGGGPHLVCYEVATGKMTASVMVFPASFTGGLHVAAHEGWAAVCCSPGAGGGPTEVYVNPVGGGVGPGGGDRADSSLRRGLGIAVWGNGP